MADTALARCDVFADWSTDFSQCLYEWQTLEAAGLATIAAAFTIYLLWIQINKSDQYERERLKRQHRAKRFLMAHTLSNISRYADEAIKSLRAAVEVRKGAKLSGNWRPPVFPSETVQSLAEFLETSENNAVNELVGELITQLQVLDARLESLVADEDTFRIGVNMNIAEYQLQASKIRQICGALFWYARGQTETVVESLAKDELIGSLDFVDAGRGNSEFEKACEAFKNGGENWWPRARDD